MRSRSRPPSLSRPAFLGLVVAVVALLAAGAGIGLGWLRWLPGMGDGQVERTVVGYVPYWDQQRGFDVVLEHPDTFDQISPFWYAPAPDGDIVLADETHTTVDREMVRYLQDQGIKVIPTIANLRQGEWDLEAVPQILHDQERVDAHVRAIVDLVESEGYDGIDVDYESLNAADRQAYSAFVQQLADALHAKGRLLTTTVHPKRSPEGSGERNVAQDFEAIGAAADQVRVMTYDYHWATSEAGPVAPASWVEEVIAYTVTQVPPEKVLLRAVLLGYDWVGEEGETVDHQQAIMRAREQGAQVRTSADGSPVYTYTDEAGREHTVWFEDEASVRRKLELVEEYGLGGAFFWRLGGEDREVWNSLPTWAG